MFNFLFRRQFLLQCLMVLLYLLSLTSQEREKFPKKIPFVLSDDQLKKVADLKIRCIRLLEKIGPGARDFVSATRTLNFHEKAWIQWKKEGCPSFEKKSSDALKNLGRPKTRMTVAINPDYLGNDDMTWLWNQGKHIDEVLSRKYRKVVTDLDKFIVDLDYQVKEDGETLEEGIDDEAYVLYNEMRWNWLAYRLAVRDQLKLFNKTQFDSKKPGKSLLMEWRKARRRDDEDINMENDNGTDTPIPNIEGPKSLEKGSSLKNDELGDDQPVDQVEFYDSQELDKIKHEQVDPPKDEDQVDVDMQLTVPSVILIDVETFC